MMPDTPEGVALSLLCLILENSPKGADDIKEMKERLLTLYADCLRATFWDTEDDKTRVCH